MSTNSAPTHTMKPRTAASASIGRNTPARTTRRNCSPTILGLIHALGGREGLDFVRQCMEVHWAVAERHLAVAVLPGEGMFEPVSVVALRIVLTSMGAAAFGPE